MKEWQLNFTLDVAEWGMTLCLDGSWELHIYIHLDLYTHIYGTTIDFDLHTWIYGQSFISLSKTWYKTLNRLALIHLRWTCLLSCNELWDLTAGLLSEVCHDVCMHPPPRYNLLLVRFALSHTLLQILKSVPTLTSCVFGGLRQLAVIFDVRVFYPNTPSYCDLQLNSRYRYHERHTYDRNRAQVHSPHLCSAQLEAWAKPQLSPTVRLASAILINKPWCRD